MNTTEKTTFDRETVTQIGKDARTELHNAIDRAAERAQPVADRLASRAHASVDTVGDTIDNVSGGVLERGKQLGVAYSRFAETGRGYVRTRPAVSLLVAVAAGYGLSKLLGSRKA
ncbi:MAG: hypothetical protein V4754_19100 [Pseudomonadota bacterium]